jgi:hypothetical protein
LRGRDQPAARSRLADVWQPLALGVAYLLTRLAAVGNIPIFLDEGTYLWLAQQFLRGELSRGWGHGKPLVVWLMAVPLGLGINGLYAARIAAVVMGGVGLAATVALTWRAVSPRAAFIVGWLWVLTPYILFFERIATPDAVLADLAMFAIWLSWEVFHSARARPALALLAGLSLAAAAMAKLPVGLFFFLAPGGLWLADRSRPRGGARLILVYALPALFAAGVAAVVALRLMRGQQTLAFGLEEIFTKGRATGSRWELIRVNAAALAGWLWIYLTPGLAVAALAGWLLAFIHRSAQRVLAILSGIWLLAFVWLAATYWVPRYALPVIPILLLLSGAGIDRLLALIWQRLSSSPAAFRRASGAIGLIGAAIIVAPAVWLDTGIIRDPITARVPAIDHQQYIAGSASGFGTVQTAAVLEALVATAGEDYQIIVRSIDDYGRLMPYLSPAAAGRLTQVQIPNGTLVSDAQQAALLMERSRQARVTFYVVLITGSYPPGFPEAFPGARLETVIPKPDGSDRIEIWRMAAGP